MLSIKTEISESIDTAPSEVELQSTQSINEVMRPADVYRVSTTKFVQASYNSKEEYFLFGTVLEASMIEKRY